MVGTQTHVHNGGFLYDENDPTTKRRAFRSYQVPIKYAAHIHRPGRAYALRQKVKKRLAGFQQA